MTFFCNYKFRNLAFVQGNTTTSLHFQDENAVNVVVDESLCWRPKTMVQLPHLESRPPARTPARPLTKRTCFNGSENNTQILWAPGKFSSVKGECVACAFVFWVTCAAWILKGSQLAKTCQCQHRFIAGTHSSGKRVADFCKFIMKFVLYFMLVMVVVVQSRKPRQSPHCPPAGEIFCQSYEHQCRTDKDCRRRNEGDICCLRGCKTQCMERPGLKTCPDPSSYNINCITYRDQCQYDSECKRGQKCCLVAGCGRMCVPF
ncbi:uncharacterized protein [Penaeus vannamei]|uniref:uncharacterized protein n=1 Tax=Penaeus vannamei TaxID=6689 RepID=UPI00387F954C